MVTYVIGLPGRAPANVFACARAMIDDAFGNGQKGNGRTHALPPWPRWRRLRRSFSLAEERKGRHRHCTIHFQTARTLYPTLQTDPYTNNHCRSWFVSRSPYSPLPLWVCRPLLVRILRCENIATLDPSLDAHSGQFATLVLFSPMQPLRIIPELPFAWRRSKRRAPKLRPRKTSNAVCRSTKTASQTCGHWSRKKNCR